MSRPNTPTDKTLNAPACNKALKRRGSLTIWSILTWSCALATMKRPSPPKPRRDMRRIRKRSGGSFSRRLDALREPKVRKAKLLGQRLTARDFDRQVAEIQIRVAVRNGFTALGIAVTKVVEKLRPGEGAVRLSADLCSRALQVGNFAFVYPRQHLGGDLGQQHVSAIATLSGRDYEEQRKQRIDHARNHRRGE